MAQQTAVEWLSDNLIGNPYTEEDFRHNVSVFQQAKKMEKEQHTEDYKLGYKHGIGDTSLSNMTINKTNETTTKQ